MKILQGKWNWKLKGHIMFLNAPDEGADEYFKIAIEDLRKSECEYSNLPIIIHSDQYITGLPEEVRKLEVAHVHSLTVTEESLKRANIYDAAIIVVLANHRLDPVCDSIVFDLVHRIRAMGVEARIIAEVVCPENKQRLRDIGANNIIRPVRSYPELVVRAIIAPGSEQVIEELVSYQGATTMCYDVLLRTTWKNVQTLFLENDLGILIGYVDDKGIQHLGQSQDGVIDICQLIAIVRNGQCKSAEQMRMLVQNFAQTVPEVA